MLRLAGDGVRGRLRADNCCPNTGEEGSSHFFLPMKTWATCRYHAQDYGLAYVMVVCCVSVELGHIDCELGIKRRPRGVME